MATPAITFQNADIHQGWRLLILEEADSTNDALRNAVFTGEARTGDAVMAYRQTAGRGRNGADWASPEGNLCLSLAIDDRKGWGPLWSLVTGLAVRAALCTLRPALAADIRLKWPNDLMARDAKLGGILIETTGHRAPFVIGIGVNLASHPHISGRETISVMALTGEPIAADVAAHAILEAVTALQARYEAAAPGAMAREWLAHAWGLGRSATCRLPEGPVSGIAEAIRNDGALILRLSDGTSRAVTSGEVLFGTIA